MESKTRITGTHVMFRRGHNWVSQLGIALYRSQLPRLGKEQVPLTIRWEMRRGMGSSSWPASSRWECSVTYLRGYSWYVSFVSQAETGPKHNYKTLKIANGRHLRAED